jgi:hypothetical protein
MLCEFLLYNAPFFMALMRSFSSDGLNVNFSTTKSKCDLGEEFGSLKQLSLWIPQIDPGHPQAHRFLTPKTRRIAVLYACFATAFLVFITNLTLTLWAWISIGIEGDGVSTLFQGDCTMAKNLDTSLHVLINILSTLLLGASNMGLQLVAAPTRAEIAAAHSKGAWLDIGVPSYRNLRSVSKGSVIIWCCLAISSIPVHFL